MQTGQKKTNARKRHKENKDGTRENTHHMIEFQHHSILHIQCLCTIIEHTYTLIHGCIIIGKIR